MVISGGQNASSTGPSLDESLREHIVNVLKYLAIYSTLHSFFIVEF